MNCLICGTEQSCFKGCVYSDGTRGRHAVERMTTVIIDVYRDEVVNDGCIHSGPKVDSFEVNSLGEVKAALEARFKTPFQACADGSDGQFENSSGYGFCLVSNVRGDR